MYVWYLRPEEGMDSPRTGVKDGYKLLCGSWESKPDPLEKQPVLLPTEPSFQPYDDI